MQPLAVSEQCLLGFVTILVRLNHPFPFTVTPRTSKGPGMVHLQPFHGTSRPRNPLHFVQSLRGLKSK